MNIGDSVLFTGKSNNWNFDDSVSAVYIEKGLRLGKVYIIKEISRGDYSEQVRFDNIDAWLVATGTGTDGAINTCSDVAVTDKLTGNVCKGSTPTGKTLKINGPVIAKKIYLRRTYNIDPPGAVTNTVPAEIINLRADSYLWAAAQAVKTPRIQTIYTTEAPPRY